jgi:cytoskeleton protein RodZ
MIFQEEDKILAKSESETLQAAADMSSLGQILKERRQSLGIEIIDVGAALRIKVRDVEAIENDDLSGVTKHLYILGLIRAYAKFLKIDQKIIEEKTRVLPIKSNVENKKHQLLNIGENIDLTPDKDSLFNFLLIGVLLFLVLLSLYNSAENKSDLITNETLIHELENAS